jgi:hypothetical protein
MGSLEAKNNRHIIKAPRKIPRNKAAITLIISPSGCAAIVEMLP